MRILIADDDEFYRVFLSRMLEKVSPDAEIVLAETGDEAMRLLPGCDAAILDHCMPGKTGWQVYRKAERLGIPALLLSGSNPIAIGAKAVVVIKGTEAVAVSLLVKRKRRGAVRRFLSVEMVPAAL